MTIHRLSNPHSFVRECRQKGIRFEHLLEAVACMGQQKVCGLFEGRSARGGVGHISAGTLQNWLCTFQFSRDHPGVPDNDPFQSRGIQKKGNEYDDFVRIVMTPIEEDTRRSWETMSLQRLGDEAIRHGMTLGIRNTKAIQNLRERMMEMYRRRRERFWDAPTDDATADNDETQEYRLHNIFTLHEMAKQRGIPSAHMTKDEIIKSLEENDNRPPQQTEAPHDYDKMNSRQLKELAKQRSFTVYNNLNNTSLRELHRQYDEAVKDKKEEALTTATQTDGEVSEFHLTHENGERYPILIREDGMVNATLLCKAADKQFVHYQRNDRVQAFIEAVETDLQKSRTELIIVRQGGDPHLQGTWVHRLIAIDCARWLNPRFALQVIKWTDELLTRGSVRIERPLLPILDRSDLDIEAETLESSCDLSTNTNNPSLYVAYIGDGLVKVGYSSCFPRRESKHLSSESPFGQFRLLRVFEISSQSIETQIHGLLDRYRAVYQKQKEVYRPSGSLEEFLGHVDHLLRKNDLRLQLQKAREEIMRLRLVNAELELRILKGTA